MKRKLLPTLLLSTLIIAMISATSVLATDAQDLVIVVQLKGAIEAGDHLIAAIGNFTNIEWKVVTGDLTSADLSGADMLIAIQSDMSVNYTNAELNAVKKWYDSGVKTLWVCGDSDYTDQYMRQPTANELLAKVGAKLRVESCEAEDALSNAFASYRVYGISDNCDDEVGFLVDGVNTALFHGPGVIAGYLGGNYYALDVTSIDGVYVVMTTSEKGLIVDVTPPAPEVHEVGDEGNFALMALELSDNYNILIATADAPFDHYTPMYKPELKRPDRYGPSGAPQQGAKLFENIINYVIRNKLSAGIAVLEEDVDSLESEKTALNSQISTLNSQVSSLEDEVEGLESDKTSLEGDVSSLESNVASLEDDLAAAKSSASTWQMVAVATLIIGLVAGVVIGPMVRKS